MNSINKLRDYVPWKMVNLILNIPHIPSLLQKFYRKMFSYPKIIQLHINTECNYNCKYCYIDRKTQVLSTKKWLGIIDEAKELGVMYIDFLGGEPFLFKDFYRLLQHSASLGMGITIYTNGSLIDGKWIKRLNELPTELIIAVKYDYDHRSYEIHTGQGKLFKKLQDTIKKCTSAGIPVVTFTTLTKFNVEHVKDIIKDSISLGAFPAFERYIPIKEEKTNQELEFSKEDYVNALKFIKDTYSNMASMIEGICSIRGSFCCCYIDQLSILPDGHVVPCPLAPKSLSLGNVRNMSLKEIWENNKKKQNEWSKLPKGCLSCKFRYSCGGGCKTHSYLKFGNTNTKDPLCSGEIPTYGHCTFPVLHSKIFKNAMNKISILKF